MRIRRLDTERRRDVRQWVDFPFELYRDCPQWVPPLVSDARAVLNRTKHPYYRRSTADFYVVESEGQTLGRIAVMDNRHYNQHAETETAFFGFFEVVEEIEVARRLFEAAFAWARARGLERMVGPRGLNVASSSGVLVEGFEHRPALMMAYNYAYYDALIQDSGFEKDADSLSGYLRGDYELPERFYRLAEKAKERRRLWVKTFRTKAEMRRWVPRVAQVYQTAFSEFEGYQPPTEEEVADFGQDLIAIAEPQLIKLVMKDEDVIGFVFAYPDISAGLQKANGRLWPVGWVHILRERKRTDWLNINGLGVLPEYQGRGASILLYTELAKSITAFRFQHADIVQVGEDNLNSRSDMEAIGVEWYKRHRSYRRLL